MPVVNLRARVRPLPVLLLAITLAALELTSGWGASCVAPSSGLIGWWTGNGTNVDVLGLHHATLLNGATYSVGQVGQAFLFDGTNSSVEIPDALELSPHIGPVGELTVEAWVLIPRLPQFDAPTGSPYRAVVVKGSPGNWEYGLHLTTNGQPVFTVWQSSGSGHASVTANPISLSQWHHLAGTLRKGQFIRLYVDGQLAGESTSFSGDTSHGGSPLYFGRRGDGQFFDGQLDEISVYGRALSGAEIGAIYGAGTAGKCATLPGASVPYFTDFETGAGPEWMLPNTDNTESLGFTRFLGRLGNSLQALMLTNLIPGQSYTLGFDLYVMDTWDGDSGDYVNVAVNGTQVFHHTFANYNGEPPDSSQTYAGRPDEGRANFGFSPSYVDAIYRNVEIQFIASNAVTVMAFSGQGLEDINNESWGLDNVGVRLSSSLTNTFVRSTTLPPANSTNSVAIESFTLSARGPLATSATNAANYVLRSAGADGILGNGDDTIYPLTTSVPGAGGRSVTLAVANPPLQTGLYRFQTTAGLLGTNGVALPVFTRDFTIANPVLGKIESTANDTLGTATPLPFAESPAGTGFYTGYGFGTFGSLSDVDYWSFNAEAGDLLSVRLEAESQGVYPQMYFQNSSGGNIATYDGSYSGAVGFQNYPVTTPGTYYLRVWTGSNRSRYALRLDLSRNGPQLENEGNDSQVSPNQINLNFSAGLEQGRVAGALPGADVAGDFYRLGMFNPGNAISATILYPTGALLNASQTVLSVQLEGNPTPLAIITNSTLNFTVTSNGVHYVRVESLNRNLRAQYLLTLNVADTIAPQIVTTSLPAAGTTTTAIVDRFTLGFSEDLLNTTVSNVTNYELRSAGPNGTFGDADDLLYHVTLAAPYSVGLVANYLILDGPLQPGLYRLTVGTGLQDRAFNHLAAPFVHNFTVATIPGYILENRNNDLPGLATSLSPSPTTNGNGTVSWIGNVSTPAQPQGIAAGRFNADTYLDLVTANWNAGNITIFTNNGAGSFTTVTNIATGNGPVAVATGNLNGDSSTDLAVANYSAGTVSILLGNGNAGFLLTTNLSGFSNPYNLAIADLNNDNKADLIVPNYGNGTVSVLLGNGDGTFQTASNYPAGSSPETVAVGDLNADGRPDLAVANYSSGTVSVFTNTGSGTFVLAATVPCGPNPRYVVIGEVTGDGRPDLVTVNAGDNSVSVMAGNGDGTFQSRKFYFSGFNNAYQLALGDLNGDGKLDVVVPGYANSRFGILLNDGTGGFTNFYSYGTGDNPIGVAVGDFNGDGRTDAAFCHYNGNYVSLWVGNAGTPLTEDPPGSGLRTGFGRGARSNSGDVDYWQFSATAGDQVIVAVDIVGNPPASQLYYQLLHADGTELTSWYPDYTGWGQSSVATIPKTATYLVRVALNYDYQGEYRIRVTLARPPLGLENEAGNNSPGTAGAPPLTLTNGHLKTSLAGYLSVGDPGDLFNLGNLLGGTTITLGVREPATSGLGGILSVYNAAGLLFTNSSAGATNLVFTVPPGSNGLYYAFISPSPAGYAAGAETGLRFSGGSDHVTLGNWFNYQSFTLSFWANPAASQNQYADILDNNHQAGINWVIQQNSDQNNQYVWAPQDGGVGVPFTLTPNIWQHVAITRDSTNISQVFINGVLVGSNAAPGQINYDGSQFLRIARWGSGGRGWNGQFDDLRIWSRPLTQAEIVAGLTGTLTGSEPNLVGYWRFNEGAGTSALDLSPSNHVATLVNGPPWSFFSSSNSLAAGLQSQYLLSVDITNPAQPLITGVTLPANNSTNTGLITSFAVSFNEDMDPRFTTLARETYRFNGHTYLLTDAASDWLSAEAAAVALGGHLASANSAAENAFLNQTFSRYGDLWIGLNQFAGGAWSWSSGEPLTYQNWAGGEPNNSGGFEFAAKLNASGQWVDIAYTAGLRGIIEITNTVDLDADGLVDRLDPYPNDPKNTFDLRAAGLDGTFNTADDIPYRIYSTGYVSGLAAGFVIADGPLQPGNYRFQVTTALRDRFGNPLPAAFTRLFTLAPAAGFTQESRRTNGTSTTSLSQSLSNRLDGSFHFTSSTAVGANPYSIAQGDFNGDGYLDLVTANWNSGGITVLTNDTRGNFVVATNVATGPNPPSVVTGDFNGDSKVDLAVANWGNGTVTILLGDGAGGFTVTTNLSGFSNPWNLTTADFNHDSVLDLVVPSYSGGQVTVLFGNGAGGFTNATTYPVGAGPETVRPGDLNGDGHPDLVVANYNSSTFSVLLGSSNGTFTVTTNYPTPGNPRYTTLADVNGDGRLDAITVNNGNFLSVAFGNGDGTFQARTDYNIGSGDTYQVVVADLNNDGALDLVIPGFGANRLYTLLNNGDGTFGATQLYNSSGNLGGNPIGVVVGDYNHDGRLDIAGITWSANNVFVLLGNDTEGLALDPAGTGLRIGAGRGNLADSGDLDHWTFSARTGDRCIIATETLGNPTASQLLFRVYDSDGSQVASFYSDFYGRGQYNLLVPSSGTYTIRIEPNYQYFGEYRLRVTLAPPPTQMEVENNDAIGNANGLNFAIAAGAESATVLGYVGNYDTAGDYFQLGNLAAGTQITLGFRRPASSGLLNGLLLYNSSGVVVTNSPIGATNLVFTIPDGADGAYYAQVFDAGPAAARTYSGSNGAALWFNGGSSWVGFTNAVIPAAGDFTVEAWAYGFGAGCCTYREILSQGSGGNAFYLGFTPDNKLRAGDGWGDTGVPFPFDGWHHYAVVKSGTNTLLYVDGTLAASRGGTIPNPASDTPFRIGRQYGGYGEYWAGDIDEVRIWNVTRTAAELTASLTNRLSGSETGLVGYWRFDEGSGLVLNDATTNANRGAIQGATLWLPSNLAGGQPASILSQYLLDLRLSSANPPTVTSLSLPAEGTTNTGLWDGFSLTFSQDMNAGTVANTNSYELRWAGADNVFGTGDDRLYRVINSPAYAAGTNATYSITDGPLQPGRYRFTANTNLADRTLGPLATNYVRNFTILNLPGFFFEGRSNNSFATATSLSLAPTNRPDGSFSAGPSVSLPSTPQRLAAGRLNNDTNMDLVVCQYNYPGVTVLLGNGDGSFTIKTNYTTGAGAASLALGNFNSGTNLDLAVANYGASTITVLLGNGDGSFQVLSNYAVGAQPYHIITGDFNNDGKTDLAVAFIGSGNLGVLLGNGDGSFQPLVNYASGSGPVYVTVGDVNSDGKSDLVVANYRSDNVSLFLGNGNGTFAAPVTLVTGHIPRAVVLRDLNGDGRLDLAVLNGGDNTVSVMFGNGDGSFQPRVNYVAGIADGLELLAGDVNGDGWPDLVVGGYNNSVVTVIPNHGDGTFESPTVYVMGGRTVGLAAADFNNDGRLDIAAASDNGNAVWTLLGNDSEPVAPDGVLRTTAGRGSLISGDMDYWSFTGQVGDIMNLAAQNPGDPGASGLLYRIYYPDGTQWTYFYSDYSGRGQFVATLPVSGTYYLRVEQNYGYVGEYRFRLTLARPPVQVEVEPNDSVGQANSLTYTNSAGHRRATALGYVGSGDGSGDFYQLGSLSAGAVINLGAWQPPSSGFANVLEIYNAAATLLTNSVIGATNLSYTVPVGGAGAYYARIRAVNSALPSVLLHPTGGTNTLLYTPNSYSEALLAVPSAALTVTLWFRTLDPNAGLFSVSDGGSGHDRHIYLNSGGNINARLFNNQSISSTGLALADGNWHHVVYTYGSAISGQKLYVDGVVVATGTKADSDFTANNRVRFGFSQDAPNNYLNGYLDEARIWNYAFGPAEVSLNRTNTLTGSEPGLIGYWRFNEDSGIASVDRTTNAHNAVFFNGPLWGPAVTTGIQVAPGLFAQYLLDLDVSDAGAPVITGTTLPANGSTNLSIIDRFTLTFTKALDPAINNLNRYIRVYNGHGYTLTDAENPWYSAETQARAFGGHLVAINDSLENTFVNGAFGSFGNLWIGLSDEARHGTYVWSSGDPFAYTNWDSSQPDNASNQDYAVMRANGAWATYVDRAIYRGVVEVAGPDSDGDGIPDTLDPYPFDPYNGVDLRAAGADGLFDTPDDVVYRLPHDAYSGGLSLVFYVIDGPLQAGKYRFMVTGSLRDLFGNSVTPFTEYFTIAGVPNYVTAGRTNSSSAAATALTLTEDPAGLKSAAGRGKLFDGNDRDWYSFIATNGDWLRLSTEVPGVPAGARHEYQVYAPDGTRIVDFIPDYSTSLGQTVPVVLLTNGTYLVQVSPYDGYYGEYRFRVATVRAPLQFELEDNGSIANATPLTLVTNGTARSGSVAGYVRSPGDLDYISLGTVSNGYSIFVNVRQPSSSPLAPIVSVYDSGNVYLAEAPGGRSDDGIVEVRVIQTGVHYVLVRGSGGSGGLDAQYLLDVEVRPTGSILFPNLVVSAVTLPSASGLLSGQTMTYSFTVSNIGSTNTVVANWLDRAVLSPDGILGNADDIPLGFFPHAAALAPGASYTVTNTFQLPDGLSGDFHIIVQTDAGNAVNEFIFEGDNTTVSAATFHVNLAPYPDVRVENLSVAGPGANNVYTITWNTANRGTGPAAAGFFERFTVRNITSGALLANLEQPIASTLATNATVLHTQQVTATNAGNYLVTVVTESHDDLWEFDGSSHATAEGNNTATASFAITAYYTVALSNNVAGAGTLTGAGTYGSGSAVTVTATPVTNTLPYLFVNWTEGGVFQSAGTNYSFIIAGNRSLVANFTLPSYLLSASNNPPYAGSVSGQGGYFFGSTNVLTAEAGTGYRFTNWTENGSVIATTPSLTVVVRSNRLVVANYVEANTTHYVTTATSPTNLVAVTGAGTYTNGATTTLTAAVAVTNAPTRYAFREFRLNGSFAGTGPSFAKTFSTLDPTNLQYVAFYDTFSILPAITEVIAGVTNPIVGSFNIVTNPVGAVTNWQLTLTFDRSMNTSAPPAIVITNRTAAVQPVVPTNGIWLTTVVNHDTYRTPYITFGPGMDGAATVTVSGARDLNGLVLPATNVAALVIDVTPPVNPTLSLSASNSSSATVSWASYIAPADLGTFRLYLATSNFTSVAGLVPVTTLGASARSYTYSGLALDTLYHAAVAAVDNAGNSAPGVTSLAFSLPSATPPPVPLQVVASGPSSAHVSWNGYDTTYLFGFAGFRLYYEASNFTSIASLTPRQTLAADTRSVEITNLDRTKTWRFAVVGYNGNNAFNPSVTTASWSDPYAGNISANLTIGGAGLPVVDILRSITVLGNAVITIPPGTMLRFATGTSLTIQQGQLSANGTSLDPIVFTSAKDQPGFSAAPGDWNGIFLGSGAGGSLLRHVFVNYGAGLTLSNCAPTVDAFTGLNNTPAGLRLLGTASLTTSNALLALNDIGVQQLSAGTVVVLNSDLKNNGTNALAGSGRSLVATQNWWGSAVAGAVTASVQGAVTTSPFLTSEPLLTPAIGTVGGVTQVGSPFAPLRLACRTAVSLRLSEDSTFNAVFFAPFTNSMAFPLSAGGGLKTIFAQFRSVTGQTSAPVSLTINYITAGPTITAFNLDEGRILNRPLLVTGSASAPLGLVGIEFYVDGVGQGTNGGGNFAGLFDVRNLSSATHRVELLARDTAGNFTTLAHNVVVLPTPPPAPVITQPPADLSTNGTLVTITGTAEPLVPVRLVRSGSVVATTNANAGGSFGFPNVALVEGPNAFTAVATDALGSAPSAVRNVSRDTVPPAALVFDPPAYTPGVGLRLSWHFPAVGKHATWFQAVWSTTTITNVSQALGMSLPRVTLNYTVEGLPTANYYFYVVGYDDNGNISPLSAPLPYRFDASPPSFTVAFDKASPVGVGPVVVTLTASESLAAAPTLTVQPAGSPPALLPLTNAALNTYQGVLSVTALLPSGAVQLNVAGQDLAGNPFNGAPAGPALVIDVTPPNGVVTTVPGAPIQTTNSPTVTVSLQLTEAAKPGTVPVLNFNPPIGASVPIVVTGSGTNWSGPLQVTLAMGSGLGHFTLTVNDALDNVGHNITTGSALEIYNTSLPTPPGQPVGFTATSLAGGRVQLSWLAVTNAEIYRVYSDPGTNQFVTPTTLIADNVPTNGYVDLPAADGSYRYAVTALRRGAEGTNSITRVAVSDRTPPATPTNVTLQLVAAGLQISWQAGAGGPVPHHYSVYRNGALLNTVGAVTPVIDSPPRGVMSYTVAAADALGNEAASLPATIQLLVGAVNNLQALVSVGAAPALTWESGDPTAVGFNVYRNGIKQNAAPLATGMFSDSLPPAGQTATYAVTSLNATNAESVARTVVVYPVNLALLMNGNGAGANPPLTSYFDDCLVTVSNLTAVGALPLLQIQVQRTADGVSQTVTVPANTEVSAGGQWATDVVMPGANNPAAQTVRLIAYQQTDSQGSQVTYQKTFSFPTVVTPGVMVNVSANQLPLAGGLNSFNVQVFNRGYAPMYFATERGGGSQPGDLYISVLNPQGQEIGRTPFKDVVAGAYFDSSGTGYAMVPPGSSTTITVPGVLVPLSLASNTVTFQAVVSAIYDRITAGQQSSGPLSGSMQSDLTETEYYATGQTDHPAYYNDQPIVISGQARDRLTNLPVPNVPVKIGFATRGYKWFVTVTNDAAGHFTYTNFPTPGLAGSLTLWAAHPDIFDQLNQAQVAIYRFYASPATGDIKMSKNDTLDFSLQLINPSDLPLTGFTVSVEAYTMQGTNRVPNTKLHGISLMDPSFAAGPNQRPMMNLRLSADLDAPDNAVVVFTITSAEGASATFTGNVTLLSANPLITVIRPNVGYLEVSLNRGTVQSGQLIIANHGLRDLLGVTLVPPTNVNWMLVNLATNVDGSIAMPDLPVGGSNSFTVVFAPPTNTPLGFYQDTITVRGTNAVATFALGVYARVTSASRGNVQFYVDDILGLAVPNSTVRMQNVDLQVELNPLATDINGYVTVTNLQEGNWNWQVSANGHSARVGSVNVVGGQTVPVAPPDTRLSRSLVTVNFTVVPVPFTDKYDIQIEQTFETHVPAPVLVLDPTYLHFDNVKPGFEVNFIVTAKNHGLIALNNVTISGAEVSGGKLTPLIEYLPALLPLQSVEIPYRATYQDSSTGQQSLQALRGRLASRQADNPCDPSFSLSDCLTGGFLAIGCGLIAMNSFVKGDYHCAADGLSIGMAQGLLVGYGLFGLLLGGLGLATEGALAASVGALAGTFGCLVQGLASLFIHGSDSGGSSPGAPGGAVGGYGGNFGGCFAAETRVLLEDGRFKTIDQIKPGDRVRTGGGRIHAATVTETHERVSERTRELRYALPGTAEAEAESVRVTDEHLFWVDGKGWTEAQALTAGQWLFDDTGRRLRIVENRPLGKRMKVYTFRLFEDSVFYANNVLVHDLCGNWTTNGPVVGKWPAAPRAVAPRPAGVSGNLAK